MLSKFMLRVKENEEFDKWWQHWISTLAQRRIVVKHPAYGNKSGDDVEGTTDAGPGNLDVNVRPFRSFWELRESSGRGRL